VQKTTEPIEMSFGICTWMGARKHVLAGDAHWRHLANADELSMCCGDAAFFVKLLYFDNWFSFAAAN